MLTGISFVVHLVGSCWLFMFIVQDITMDLTNFNLNVQSNEENQGQMIQNFYVIIQLYSDAKQLS